MKTQTELYELVNASYQLFLISCTTISHRADCDEATKDAIEDLLNQSIDSMVDLEITAKRADEKLDQREAKLDRQHERFEISKLRM